MPQGGGIFFDSHCMCVTVCVCNIISRNGIVHCTVLRRVDQRRRRLLTVSSCYVSCPADLTRRQLSPGEVAVERRPCRSCFSADDAVICSYVAAAGGEHRRRIGLDLSNTSCHVPSSTNGTSMCRMMRWDWQPSNHTLRPLSKHGVSPCSATLPECDTKQMPRIRELGGD